IHVMTLNYRGSTGYGRSFEEERSGHEGRKQDVIAALDYLEQNLGVGPADQHAFGYSYGTRLLVEMIAANLIPDRSVYLTGLGTLQQRVGRGELHNNVFIFQGEWDFVSPEHAAAAVRSQFESLGERDIRLMAVKQEGHDFTRVNSLAAMYGMILDLITSSK